jgi:hypothetical protein
MAALLLRLSLLLLLQQCAVTQTATSSSLAGRAAFATISTQNGTAPRFPCTSSASLVFKPRAALAARLLQAGAESGRCWLFGANAAGEYILSPGKELPRLLIKAIDMSSSVLNLGGATVFSESWSTPRLQDGDAWADIWRATPSCGANGASTDIAGLLTLARGCSVTTVPHEVRTFNFFRHPLSLTATVRAAAPATAVRIALAVPTAAAVASTGWPSVRHYLQPLRNESDQADGAAAEELEEGAATACLAAIIAPDGVVELQRRRVAGGKTSFLHNLMLQYRTSSKTGSGQTYGKLKEGLFFAGGPVTVLGRAQLPAGCGHKTPATVTMFAGSVFTVSTAERSAGSPAPPLRARLHVFCGANDTLAAANISADLGLGFLDDGGK